MHAQQIRQRHTVIADHVIPKEGLVRDALLIIAFTGFIAASAKISIPLWFTPVPITGQTLAVLLTGSILGSRRGALAIIVYLGEGMVGLPVFAGSGGIFTYGYLIGFVPAAFVTGFLSERGWYKSYILSIGAMLIGNVCIYVFGVPWLALAMALPAAGVEISGDVLEFVSVVLSDGNLALLGTDVITKAVEAGLKPFIPGDLFKVVLASTVAPSAWAIVGNRKEYHQR